MYTRLYGGITENWTSPTILMEASQSNINKICEPVYGVHEKAHLFLD
jgi:hypothetical protein